MAIGPEYHRHELLAAGAIVAFTQVDVPRSVALAERALLADPTPGTALRSLSPRSWPPAPTAFFAGRIDGFAIDVLEHCLATLGDDTDPWNEDWGGGVGRHHQGDIGVGGGTIGGVACGTPRHPGGKPDPDGLRPRLGACTAIGQPGPRRRAPRRRTRPSRTGQQQLASRCRCTGLTRRRLGAGTCRTPDKAKPHQTSRRS